MSHRAHGRPEDPVNFATYACATVLSFVGVVFLLISSVELGASAIASAAVFGALYIAAFGAGALSHILPEGGRAICARWERCIVCIVLCAAFAPVFLFGFMRGGKTDAVWGYTLFSLFSAVTVIAVAVNVADVKGVKMLSLILYTVAAWTVAVRIDRVIDLCGWECFGTLLSACVLYFIGIVVCAWDVIPARHVLRHIFIMCGAALGFVSVYVFLF